MHRIPFLVAFSAVLVQLLRWLDKNFERLLKELREQCPEAPEAWIADQIVTLAFDGGF